MFRLPLQERQSVKDLITLTPNKVLTIDCMLGPVHVSLGTIFSDHHFEDLISPLLSAKAHDIWLLSPNTDSVL